jgi:hypothetical protein
MVMLVHLYLTTQTIYHATQNRYMLPPICQQRETWASPVVYVHNIPESFGEWVVGYLHVCDVFTVVGRDSHEGGQWKHEVHTVFTVFTGGTISGQSHQCDTGHVLVH